jgi:hypothetical protein
MRNEKRKENKTKAPLSLSLSLSHTFGSFDNPDFVEGSSPGLDDEAAAVTSSRGRREGGRWNRFGSD